MGFYLRKSISVGPLRFNLSKSGIGGVTAARPSSSSRQCPPDESTNPHFSSRIV
jgi:hypothetical protein